jgi:Domain of unknown function (DUF6457)
MPWMNQWLEDARQQLTAALGASARDYDLSPADVEELLELARVASHESGDRTNAPIISYLVGLAHGRHPERVLTELTTTITRNDASNP